MHDRNNSAELMRTISGVEDRKCMTCGKCSASCPSYEEMDIKTHQFVSCLRNGDVAYMLASNAIWKCLSCFVCIERCPRDVKPAQIIEAARLMVIREQGKNYLTPDDVPGLLDPELPQQLLASAFRKYAK